MAHDPHEYRAADLAAGAEIKAELKAQGIESYPAVCQGCHGAGKVAQQKCEDCDGKGSYELAV